MAGDDSELKALQAELQLKQVAKFDKELEIVWAECRY
jgi:hypothetical protein